MRTNSVLDGNYDGEGIYHEALELVRGLANLESADHWIVPDALRDWVTDQITSDDYGGLRGDLLGAALSEVDWQELASHKLEEVREADES